MKYLISILVLYFSTPFQINRNSKNIESEKYLNFLAAIQNNSTFNYFTVIKVKNLNTGVIKEICTKGNFVSGALHIELKADYDEKGGNKVLAFVNVKKDRYFELKNKVALENISFFDYNIKQLSKMQEKYDFDKVIEIIKRDKKFRLGLSKNEMKYFAHLLFNKGFMTGESDCFSGALEYIDRTKTKD